MIKDIIAHNETVSPNDREMSVLRENFPSCFKSDGSFDIERFREFLSDKVAVTHEGYELKFLGKNYARLLAAEETTTVISPDIEHNSRPENADSENIYISADNLDALKHLLKSYAGRVKCIYIDPPYNTGKDDFVYNDSFSFTAEELSVRLSIDIEQAERILDLTKRGSASHSAWLMFMYPRLLLARDLLAKNGVIFISIDDNEQANLKMLCDDVFGEENDIGTIIWKNATDNNPTNIAIEHEYILCFCRDRSSLESVWKSSSSDIKTRLLETESALLSEYADSPELLQEKYTEWYNANKSQLGKLDGYKFIDSGGLYAGSRSVHNPGKNGYFYDVIHPTTGKPCASPLMGYRFPESTMKKMIDEGKIIFGETEAKIIEIKQYLHEYEDKLSSVIEVDGRSGANSIRQLFDNKNVFKNPKTPQLFKEILPFILGEDDIVLDFFSGSATTAHSVMNLNVEDGGHRKYILVQLPEETDKTSEAYKAGYSTIDEIGQERIKRAAAKIREDHPETTADLGFKHYTLYEPTSETLDKLEKFSPDQMFSNLLDEFGVPTVLTTWLVRDGYGFTAKYETLDFAGYEAYFCGKHLYLINEGLSDEAITAICEKLESDADFNPENIVLFGYSFTWGMRDTLQINVKRLKDTEKNLRVNFDVRY